MLSRGSTSTRQVGADDHALAQDKALFPIKLYGMGMKARSLFTFQTAARQRLAGFSMRLSALPVTR
jgi:hypothetical protein